MIFKKRMLRTLNGLSLSTIHDIVLPRYSIVEERAFPFLSSTAV
jgi:hypothetical protein